MQNSSIKISKNEVFHESLKTFHESVILVYKPVF